MKKKSNNLKGIILLLSSICFSFSDDKFALKNNIKDLIAHADTYYWLGMEENGDIKSFNRGLYFLNQADSLLRTLENSDKDYLNFSNQSSALRGDLDNQIIRASDRFIGTFPISNIIGYNFFTKNKPPGTYEMVDDPRVTSAINATSNLVNDIAGKWGKEPQIDVVFTSLPKDQELENEALYLFNQSSKYFVHNKKEVRSVLAANEMNLFEKGVMSDQMKNRLIDAFNSSTLMMVVIRKLDHVDDVYFYLAEGHTYNKNSSGSIRQFYTMGFSRDGRDNSGKMTLFIVVLFVLTIVFYNGMNYFRNQSGFSLKPSSFFVPIVYFLFGMILPFLIQPVISAFKPDLESFSRISFWWPLVMGVSILSGPNAVLFVASTRLGNIIPGLLTGSRGGSTAVAITAGSLCYFSVPLVLFDQPVTSIFSVLMIIAVLFSAYLFGLAVDRVQKTPVEYVILSLFIFAGVGLGIYTLNIKIMFLMALSAIFVTWYENKKLSMVAIDEDSEVIIDEEFSGLKIDPGRFANPDYLPLSYYNDDIEEWVNEFKNDRQNPVLTLFGSSGVGKTATANYITKILSSQYGEKIVVLRGQCAEPLSDSTDVFKPFKEALQKYFHINLLGTDDQKMEQIEGAMGAVFNSVLPIAGVFLPAVTPEESKASTKKDIFHAVWKMLQDLSKSKIVLVYIDDIQWIDTDSLELLDYLLNKIENLNDSGESGLAFVLTGRSEEDLPNFPDETSINFPDRKVLLNGPTDEERADILHKQLGFKKSAAEAIVTKAKAGTALNGGMFWVIQIIIQLAQDNLLKETSSGIDLSVTTDSIPIPSNMQDALEVQLDQFPEFIPLLECAACLGRQFTATVLSESLELDRLEILSKLKDIEHQSGIIKDIKESDDMFEFHSSFMLKTIRDRLSINGSGPSSSDVPQIIREYHQRASRSLQKQYDSGRSDIVFELADHYYASGTALLEQAYEVNILAANASVGVYNFKQAFSYLSKARECGKLSGLYDYQEINDRDFKSGKDSKWICEYLDRDSWSRDEILIACQYAHVTGKNEAYIANITKQFYDNLSAKVPEDIRMKILQATALALYDAEEKDDAKKYSSKIIDLSINEEQKATGFQLKGLSIDPQVNRSERLDNLEKAYQIIGKIRDRSLSEDKLYGKILNSLGNDYMHIPEKMERGLELLEERIQLNEQKNLGDMFGMALTYGAIGRHYLYNADEIETARKNFQADLDITIELNDIEGQSLMYSFLGQCDEKEKKYQNALENFQSAIRYAEQMDESGFRNILFPCRSGINICAKISEIDTAESLGVKIHETLEKFQSKLSPEEPIFKKMEKSSELWKKHFTGEWIVNAIAVLEKIKKYKAG